MDQKHAGMAEIIHFLNPQTDRLLADVEKMILRRSGWIPGKMILLKQQIQVIPVGVILRDAKRLVKSGVGHDDSVFLIRKAYAVCDVIVMSATKSIVALLVGIALDKGFIKSIDQPVLEFW